MDYGKVIGEDVDRNKNFPVLVSGKIYWISRSCAVAGFIFRNINGIWYILANKRGIGAPDFVGYWNAPCGYIERDENGEEAISRETMEECGLIVKPKNWTMIGVQTEPSSSNKQNITIRYIYIMDDDDTSDFDFYKRKGGELNEVDDIEWIPINKIDDYQWAFDHDKLIKIFAIRHVLSIEEIIKSKNFNI